MIFFAECFSFHIFAMLKAFKTILLTILIIKLL